MAGRNGRSNVIMANGILILPSCNHRAADESHDQWHRLSDVRFKSTCLLRRTRLLLIGLLVIVCLALKSEAGTSEANIGPSTAELKRLSIEELLQIEVTTVSRQPELLAESPSAVQVITSEEIRRSGATSLPAALRLATNLEVARVDSRQWAITTRGFNNTLANKLLVMIDGRVVYTPLYAGVFWDVQDVLLEDIDRIEVVSGPGGTLWGTNAVNGVINIVTKSSRETEGGLLSVGGGSLLQDLAVGRYGWRIDPNLSVRVYGQRHDHNGTDLPDGQDGHNSWNLTQGGFRMDWARSPQDQITLQGDAYGGSIEQTVPEDVGVDGQNLLARWNRTLSSRSNLQVQVYVDRTWRNIPNTFTEDLRTIDLDFQHHILLGDNHNAVWGGGYRHMADDVIHGKSLAFLPHDRTLQLYSGFLQDEITLAKDRLKLTIGTKLEHNDYSGFEIQPSGRLAWLPDSAQTVWAAVSRAIRSPSRIDRDYYIPSPPVPPGTAFLSGGSDFDSEKLIAYELGYRFRPVRALSLSVATYFNSYDDLRGVENVDSTQYEIRNGLRGETWGVELTSTYQLMPWWRLQGGYTYLHSHLWEKSGSIVIGRGRSEGNDAPNSFSLRSSMDLPAHVQLDGNLRYMDRLPSPVVPSYVTMDMRLGWQIDDFEVSVVGQDLFHTRHPESGNPATRQEIPQSAYGKITWEF